MSQSPDALTTDTVERQALVKMREEAARRFAGQMYDWMNGLDSRFEAGTIDAQSAARVVSNWQRVYDTAPKRPPRCVLRRRKPFQAGSDRAGTGTS